MCKLFHKWSRWCEPFDVEYVRYVFNHEAGRGFTQKQSRNCIKCGKAQERIVEPKE